MEFVRGESIRRLLDSLPDRVGMLAAGYDYLYIKAIFIQITDAIRYLHALGICHRDLKADNVILNVERDGDGGLLLPTPKLLDFGIAKKATNSFGASGQERSSLPFHTFCGTPGYLAPEIVEG